MNIAKRQRKLISEEFQVVDAYGMIRKYDCYWYKGEHRMIGEWKSIKRDVTIKAFGLHVTETVMTHDEVIISETSKDFGHVCSRTNAVVYTRRAYRNCFNLDQMRLLIEDLMVDYKIAMDKDAEKEVKKLIGVLMPGKPKSQMPIRKRQPQPLTQIELPYEWHGLRPTKNTHEQE